MDKPRVLGKMELHKFNDDDIGDGINETCIGSILHHNSWLKIAFKCNFVEYECFEHTTPYMFWRRYNVIKNQTPSFPTLKSI
jgi:hypothetical protein